jgi:hypothetical protein
MQQKEATTASTTTLTERVITVVTTRGEKKRIPFSGTSWSELRSLLTKGGLDVTGQRFSGYSLDNMKCVEGVNKTTLEHDQARVPDGSFNLFMMPYKSKSGGEARDKVKALSQANKAAVKAHFGNWTTKKEDELATLLKTYKETSSTSTSSSKPKASSKSSTSSTKKASTKKASASVETEDKEETEVSAAKQTFEGVITNARFLSMEDQRRVIEALRPTAYPQSSMEQGDKELDKEMLELSRGFRDVKV